MTDFVSVGIVTDPPSLLDTFIDSMNANLDANGFPNWSPADANILVIAAGIIAQWASDNGLAASTASNAIFRGFGTNLIGIPPVVGAYATVTTTWTFTSAAPTGGYTIPAGAQVDIDGAGFYAQSTVVTNTGDTSASVALVSSQIGSAYNGLGGVNAIVNPVNEIDWVAQIITTGQTTGGADQESDDDYQNRLAGILQLQAPRPITAADYASMILSLLAQEQAGVIAGRATSIDGWYPSPRALSTGGAGATVLNCTIVSTSTAVTINSGLGANQVPQIGATVTAASGIAAGTTVAPSPAPTPTSFTLSIAATASTTESVTVGGLSGYGPVQLTGTATLVSSSTSATLVTPPYLGAIPAAGATITGTAIPANATIAASPAPTATTFSLSAAATSNETAETVTISEWTNVSRCVTTFVTDALGNSLTASQMDSLATFLQNYRELNFLVFVEPPNTTTIYVTAEIHVLPGYSSAAVVTAVQNAVIAYLNPATWGNPTGATTGSSTWLNYVQGFSVVRFNSIIGIVESVAGVQYAVNGQVFLGTSASPGGTSDITLTGPAPLVTSTAATIVITAV
jgi:hypothetical protein